MTHEQRMKAYCCCTLLSIKQGKKTITKVALFVSALNFLHAFSYQST